MEEIWKNIDEFGGFYQISNNGKVKSSIVEGNNFRKEERLLSQFVDKKGYLRVKFYYKSKAYTRKVHRLVAQAFIPNPNNLPQVNHKDENKTNNHAENLEWCTNEYNNHYGNRSNKAAISNMNNQSTSVPVLCVDTNIVYPSIKEAQRKTGAKNIFWCCVGKRKTSGGLHWEYATNIRRIDNKKIKEINVS